MERKRVRGGRIVWDGRGWNAKRASRRAMRCGVPGGRDIEGGAGNVLQRCRRGGRGEGDGFLSSRSVSH